MPELPEVEITARLLDSALRGARIEGALAPGINALKTFQPPLSVIAGIGRSWVDEILWEAELSPYKRGADLEPGEAERLREVMIGTLGRAIAEYEDTVRLPIPDKLPMPLRIHRHQGEPCPRCGATMRAVHFEDYVIAYCPACQTEGRVLKDRRLSRLLR